MPARKQQRHVYELHPREGGREVRSEGGNAQFRVTAEGLSAARTAAKANLPSQVGVHDRGGRFQTEFSYGQARGIHPGRATGQDT